MANAETEMLTDVDQCLALTSDGERCSRPAQENGFCFQHDEDDPTVEESDDVDADSMEGAAEELEELTVDGGEVEAASAEEDESTDGDTSSGEEDSGEEESGEEETESSTDESSADESSEEESSESSADGASEDEFEDVTIELDEPVDLTSVRDVVRSTGSDLIGRPLDAVIAVSAIDDGWRAVVECVERRAVPDTQDILGQYELLFDDGGTIQQYRRLERYRRSDTRAEEEERFER